MPYVPAVYFSRLLGFDHSLEMRRVRHILLHDEMRCFLVRQPQQRCVWTFRYPFGLAAWFGNVYGRVADAAWKAKLKPFIKWGMKLWGQAYQQMQERFVQTRKDMYSLASTIAGFEESMQHLRATATRFSSAHQARLHHLDVRWRHLSEQAGTFIQRWLAEKNALPVVQAFVVKEGEVDPDSAAVSFFATASQEDVDILNAYARAVSLWMRELQALLDELQS